MPSIMHAHCPFLFHSRPFVLRIYVSRSSRLHHVHHPLFFLHPYVLIATIFTVQTSLRFMTVTKKHRPNVFEIQHSGSEREAEVWMSIADRGASLSRCNQLVVSGDVVLSTTFPSSLVLPQAVAHVRGNQNPCEGNKC